MCGVPAYAAGVIAGTLVTAVGFGITFGVTGWQFASFTNVGILVLSLPLTPLCISVRHTTASSLHGAVLIGCVNGLISSVQFLMVAGPLAWLVMLPAGGVGGVFFWFVRYRLASSVKRRNAP